jgi:hypothetical protein
MRVVIARGATPVRANPPFHSVAAKTGRSRTRRGDLAGASSVLVFVLANARSSGGGVSGFSIERRPQFMAHRHFDSSSGPQFRQGPKRLFHFTEKIPTPAAHIVARIDLLKNEYRMPSSSPGSGSQGSSPGDPTVHNEALRLAGKDRLHSTCSFQTGTE